MIFTCPKCGKKIELSVEALIASEYYTVCPQCLSRLKIVGDTAILPVEIHSTRSVNQDTSQQAASVTQSELSTHEIIDIPAEEAAPVPQPPAIPKPPQPQYYPPPQYNSPQPQYPPPAPQYYPQESQPYYPNYNPYPPQQGQEKKKYSCTCTGCLVWGLILMGIFFLLAHM